MRAVSLSNKTVIGLLNGRYVPVYVSNEDYRDGGCAPAEEKAELRRIFQEGYAKHLSVGTVHAYILGPDGHLRDSMHTAQASRPELLIPMLQRNADALGVKPGEPIPSATVEAVPKPDRGGLALRLVSRYLERRGDDYALTGQEEGSGGWASLPSEDWILLTAGQARGLLPGGPLRVGLDWDVDPGVARDLYLHFYPPTENWDLRTNRLDMRELHATVADISGGMARIRLTGRLRMKHPFYHKDDDKFAQATVTGYMEVDSAGRSIRRLELVTDDAEYGDAGGRQSYGVALRSVP